MYTTTEKQRAYRTLSKKLRSLASDLGLPPGSYTTRSSYGGIGVAGEAILHGQSLYICVSLFDEHRTYFRSCKGITDYVGGVNHWCKGRLPTVEEIRAIGQ